MRSVTIPAGAPVFYTAKELAAYLRPRLARKRSSTTRDPEAGCARVRLTVAAEASAGSPLRFYNGCAWWEAKR